MVLTKRDKDFITFLVKQRLEHFKAEEKFTEGDALAVDFLTQEAFEAYLKDLIEKLKE